MTMRPYAAAVTAPLWALLCILFVALPAGGARAEYLDDARASASERDTEMPPERSAPSPKSRYAGWLLGAYLMAPAVAVTGIAAHSGVVALAGAALMWLAPAAVHWFAGEEGLAARTALVLVSVTGGMIVGALLGLAFGSLIPQDRNTLEEDPGLQRIAGLAIGGIAGAALGALAWAFIDVSEAFRRDAKRRERMSRTLSFSLRPERRGLSIGLRGAF